MLCARRAKRRREHKGQGRAGQNAIVTEAAHGNSPRALVETRLKMRAPDVKTHPYRPHRPDLNLRNEATGRGRVSRTNGAVFGALLPAYNVLQIFQVNFRAVSLDYHAIFGLFFIVSQDIELAVKRRSSDAQTPRDLRHLPAIMRDREPDDLGLDIFQRANLAV